MRISEVCNILKAKLPQFSNTFSENILDSSLSVSNGVVTVTTLQPHNLVVNDYIVLSGFDVETDFPKIDNNLLNTRHKVLSVPSTTTYTFNLVQTFINGSSSVNGKTHSEVGVIVSLNEELASRSYVDLGDNKTNICYVIDNGLSVSRDRKSQGDSIQSSTRSQDSRMLHISNFTILIYVKINNDTLGSLVSDTFRQLLVFLIKSLNGITLSTDWNNNSYGVSVSGMQPFDITNAYVGQAYNFEVSEQINIDDGNTDIGGFSVENTTLSTEPNLI